MPSLLFVVTEDWYFHSHRLALAVRARDAGYTVSVATRVTDHAEMLTAAGIEVIAVPFERSLRKPARDLAAFLALRRILRERRPDLVHAVSLKPILIALAAARERDRCIAAFTGLGYLFSSSDRGAGVLRRVVTTCLRRLLRGPHGPWTLVQNADDAALLAAAGIGDSRRAVLIPGAGVELERFVPAPEPATTPPLVVLPARLLVDKGVREFVAAARRLQRRGVAARCVLVGRHDTQNPGAVPGGELAQWLDEGVVEWWGHRDDMPQVLAEAALVCLPSYREGMPKALLEAGAVGRAVVTTDVPGCRDVVEQDQSGVLVPARDGDALAAAIERMLGDDALRAAHARALHERVLGQFSIDRIAAHTLQLYARVLADHDATGVGR